MKPPAFDNWLADGWGIQVDTPHQLFRIISLAGSWIGLRRGWCAVVGGLAYEHQRHEIDIHREPASGRHAARSLRPACPGAWLLQDERARLKDVVSPRTNRPTLTRTRVIVTDSLVTHSWSGTRTASGATLRSPSIDELGALLLWPPPATWSTGPEQGDTSYCRVCPPTGGQQLGMCNIATEAGGVA